jgi:hypothetical protein
LSVSTFTFTTPNETASAPLGARAAAAVDYVLEAGARVRGGECPLAHSQDLGSEDHVARGVGSVHVAERCRDQVAPALADTEGFGKPGGGPRGGVQLIAPAGGTSDAVPLTSHNGGLDLEDDVEFAASGEQSGRDPQVLIERKRRAVDICE